MWHIHVCEPATKHNTYSFHTSSVMYKYTLCKNNWSQVKYCTCTYIVVLASFYYTQLHMYIGCRVSAYTCIPIIFCRHFESFWSFEDVSIVQLLWDTVNTGTNQNRALKVRNSFLGIQSLILLLTCRHVRDRLITEDHYVLAMEVLTKCQLDTNTVRSAWGIGCIKVGEFAAAKEIFRHCFHVSI